MAYYFWFMVGVMFRLRTLDGALARRQAPQLRRGQVRAASPRPSLARR